MSEEVKRKVDALMPKIGLAAFNRSLEAEKIARGEEVVTR